MTHEQNLESAEFRTIESGFRSRREQATALASDTAHPCPYPFKSDVIERHLIEAEARGAAEQRKRAALEDEAENARFADADEESTLNALMRRHGIDRGEASEELIWWQERDKRFPLNKAEQRQKDAEGAASLAEFGTWDVSLRATDHPLFYSSGSGSESIAGGTTRTILYANPADVTALEARVKELEGELGALLDWADGQWCPHDNTHRGGSIWTICNDCGRKWADDVKPFDPDEDFEPSAIKQARAAIREGGEHG